MTELIQKKTLNSENLFKRIGHPVNQKIENVYRMKNEEVPLIIYGIGGYAKSVLKFLNKHSIKVDAACVDRDYLDDLITSWNGINVYDIREISPRFNSFNVIIGFADFKSAERKIRSIAGCKKTFFLDSITFFDFFDFTYFEKNLDSFCTTYDMLEDDLSRETFVAFINAKISGMPNDLYDLVVPDQYFPNNLITLNSNELFVDAGAYKGDTIIKFIDKVNNRYKSIFAFEPDEGSYKDLADLVQKRNFQNTFIYNKGVWKEKGNIKFNIDQENGVRSAFSENGSDNVDVESIDNTLQDKNATFIKMDIEGSELAALQGAELTIKKSKPKLAICVYHKPEDLITIPQYLKKILPGYKLFLRQHLFISQELVLYALYN